MSTSSNDEIKQFKELTGWTNEDDIINYLTAFNWDLEFAIDAYLTNLDEIDQNKERFARQDPSDELTFDENNQQITNETTSTQSLYNSFDQPETTNASNRISFVQHVEQELVSTDNSPSIIFTEINKYEKNKKQLLEYIDSNIIGRDVIIQTPWGSRKVIYADYTASGRGLFFIEDYMRDYVLPFYANTHSENNAFALQTTNFRGGSRILIKKYVNATDNDVLIFTGSGSTSAINKLVNVLNLTNEAIRNGTVVFISRFEHHSNILPWKETGVELIRIPNTKQGLIDRNDLQKQLEYYHNVVQKRIICSFNAASNVTGILTDVNDISKLVHQYDGFIFWDYAAGAPYLKIDMNPSEDSYKDAIFISTHKFVGGPSTPGILIAKKHLFTNRVPHNVGGGTVNFVTNEQIEYLKDIESREEGGTPDIIGSIKAGLVFHLKSSVGEEFIEKREKELVDKVFQRFRGHRTLLLLGSLDVSRVAIFSFVIYVPHFKKYLHHHFICVLLNDLFGIQVRSGCSCAGPYVIDLLGIDDEKAKIYTKFITEDEANRVDSIPKNALMKPGFTRFNLSYFLSNVEVEYILDAIEFVANEGWKFLSLYTFDPLKATWRPRHMPKEHNLTHFHSLHMITFRNGIMQEDNNNDQSSESLENNLQLMNITSSNDPLEQVNSMKDNLSKHIYDNIDLRSDPPLNIPVEYQSYIWFLTPKQVIRKIINDYDGAKSEPVTPFRPE